MRLMIMTILISFHFSPRSLALSSPPLLPFFLLLSSTAGKKTKSLIMVGQYMVGHTIGSVRSSFLYTFLSRCLFALCNSHFHFFLNPCLSFIVFLLTLYLCREALVKWNWELTYTQANRLVLSATLTTSSPLVYCFILIFWAFICDLSRSLPSGLSALLLSSCLSLPLLDPPRSSSISSP